MMNRAVVIGATGMVGKELVQQLIVDEGYDQVIALVRSKLSINHNKLQQYVIDFDQLEKSGEVFSGSAVFCTLGTTIKAAGSQSAFRKVDYEYAWRVGQLAYQMGASSFLIVTAMGAHAKSRIFYSRVKGQLEEELRKIPFQRLHILRPSLLLGDRVGFRLGEKMITAFVPILNILLVGPLKKYKPIHASTIAASMIAMSKEREPGVFVYESNEI